MTVQEFIDVLLARASAAGFSDAEASYKESESFQVRVLSGEIENYSVNKTLTLVFRGLYNGKMGVASTEALGEDSVELLIRTARENALLIEDETEQIIFAGSESYSAVQSFSPALEEVTAEQKIALALEMEKELLVADPRVEKAHSCAVSSQRGREILANTKGLSLSHEHNVITAVVAPVLRDGAKVGNERAAKATRNFAELDAKALAQEAVRKTLRSLGGEPIPSAQLNVVLDAEVAASLLASFSSIFSGEAAQKGRSLLGGREGQMIAASCVTLRDDPLKEDGLCSRPFDGEGVAVRVKNVIENGKLTTLLHNLKSAQKAGVSSTGNAGSNPANIAPTNFYFVPAQKTKEELYALAGDSLLITRFDGMNAGVNPVSGDFSLSSKGVRIENGVLTTPVAQITLAGNFYTLLQNVLEVGDDLHFGMPFSACFGSPSLLIKGLSVARK